MLLLSLLSVVLPDLRKETGREGGAATGRQQEEETRCCRAFILRVAAGHVGEERLSFTGEEAWLKEGEFSNGTSPPASP